MDTLVDHGFFYDDTALSSTVILIRQPTEKNLLMYFVYLVSNKYNNVLYVGVTNNVERRMAEHKCKLIDGFTKKYNVTKLVYFEGFVNVVDALAA